MSIKVVTGNPLRYCEICSHLENKLLNNQTASELIELYSLFCTDTAAGLENLNFNFADSLIESSCQGNLTPSPSVSPSMGSPHMYEDGNDIPLKKQGIFSFVDQNPSVGQLDPTFENVVDIQELLTTALDTVEGPINIDNIFPASDLDLAEGHTSGQKNRSALPSQLIIDTENTYDCMTNSGEPSPDNTSGTDGWQTLTIKSEDLDLTTSQPRSPLQSVTVSVADSQTRSNTRSTFKEPVVYTRGKPGRKPIAGGPVRNRKRQPPKDTPEYYEKRARNNIAVRKSRDKAKIRQQETEDRVQSLQEDNESLQRKVDLLTKELTVLKSLFINVGASLPINFEEILDS